MDGDIDIARIGALVADPARAKILFALGDGRALPASVLADEAGVAASTASAHLSKLVGGGLLTAERHGRHRYFRVSGPAVADLMEALARLSPPAQVRSLRQGTRAQAVRFARTCYDHLAGMLGTELMSAMIDQELLVGGDRRFDPDSEGDDRLAAPGVDVDYRLTTRGVASCARSGSIPNRSPVGAASPATASTGASNAIISRARWERRSPTACSSSDGWSERAPAAPSTSATRAMPGCGRHSASSWTPPDRSASWGLLRR
jgi:DNA-binding transcriptional ArsR family regulator